MDKGEFAHEWAQDIFDLSTKCLMAHSIRAVEHYLEHGLKNVDKRRRHRIKVRVCEPQKYLGKRAIAAINPAKGESEIQVDAGIGFEQQRLAIAHELAHILFTTSLGDGKMIVRDDLTESACKVFEEQLCLRHDRFYADKDKIVQLRFPSLWKKFGEGKPPE